MWGKKKEEKSPYTLVNCIEITAGFYTATAKGIELSEVNLSMDMVIKAFQTRISCPDCSNTYLFEDGLDSNPDRLLVICPSCKAEFAKFNISK